MKTKAQSKTRSAKTRILEKAEELFYKQGYQATGINQIIAESGVAKATFYAHFPSKDDLCLCYLQCVGRSELDGLKAAIEACPTPEKRFFCMVESMVPWLLENDLKGCGFLNIIPEVPDPKSPLRKEGIRHYREMEKIQLRLAEELVASDPKKYGHLDPKRLAKDYIHILTGGLALVEIFHDVEPMKHAIKLVYERVR